MIICRADHTIDDLREKIFPSKRRKEKTPETTVPSVSLPTKRKERTLSSLATNEASTASHSATKTLPKSTEPAVIAHRKLLFVQNKQNNTQVMERETDELNQKEDATVTSSNDCNIQDTVAKPEPIQIDDNYSNVQEHGHKPTMERVESGLNSGTSGSAEHGKLQDVLRGGRLASTNASYDQARGDVDADRRCNTPSNPIWFALVASDHQ